MPGRQIWVPHHDTCGARQARGYPKPTGGDQMSYDDEREADDQGADSHTAFIRIIDVLHGSSKTLSVIAYQNLKVSARTMRRRNRWIEGQAACRESGAETQTKGILRSTAMAYAPTTQISRRARQSALELPQLQKAPA